MINFLTKPSINDSWSVLLFDFQSDNPEFLIRMEEGKRRELIYKEHCVEAALVSHSFIDFPQKQTQRRKMHLRPGKKPHKEPCAMNSNPASTLQARPWARQGTHQEVKLQFLRNLLIITAIINSDKYAEGIFLQHVNEY